MFTQSLTAFAALFLASGADAALRSRGVPANATGVTSITSPGGATIRYKETGSICETTAGVKSYSGYVDLDATTHMFFWFFEARTDPGNAPLTLWLNGGPGSDSMIGLFQENGPCNVTEQLQSQLNPSSWNTVSNMLYLSQPVGVGYSYGTEVIGSLDDMGGVVPPVANQSANGRFSKIDPYKVDTTELAAVGTWHVLQGFLANLMQLDPVIKVKDFNLWTESYGGHYGPAFYSYFSDQNSAIANGTTNGTQLNMATLGIINGIVDEAIQAPFYPEFAVNNTYGIKAVNDTVYSQMTAANTQPNGCQDQLVACAAADRATTAGHDICANATDFCRGNVESPYYIYSNRDTYDIRATTPSLTPPLFFADFLNLASTQQSLGVNLNYTSVSSDAVYTGFQSTGDFVYPQFKTELESLLAAGVRVALFYGDADYICNWFGGEAVSLALNYTHSTEFRAAGYAPFLVDGTEYGEVRQFGNFSFMRVYEAGHEIPYYQPQASLAFFNRTLHNEGLADGSVPVTVDYCTNGTAFATHVESGGPAATQTGLGSCGSPASTGTPTGTGGPVTSTPAKSAGKRRAKVLWF